MKKRFWITAAAVLAVLAASYAGIYRLAAAKAEENSVRRAEVLQSSAWFDVLSREYSRNAFGAQETLTLKLRKEMLPENANLPAPLQTLLFEPVTLHSRIVYPPFSGSLNAAARIESQWIFTPEAEKTVQQFFGSTPPLTGAETLHWNGSGTLDAAIAPFDYEELSGIRIHWQGAKLTLNHRDGYREYTTAWHSPGLKLVLADYGEAEYENLSYRAETRPHPVMNTGSSSLKIDRIALHWSPSADARLQLERLEKMLGRLQIRSFIPSAQQLPSDIVLHNLGFDTAMNIDGGFADASGSLNFSALQYGNDPAYGPLVLEVSGSHLHAEALAALRQAVADNTAGNAAWQENILAAARNQGAPLFTQNPVFTLHRFSFDTPQGVIRADGTLTLDNLEKSELDDASALIAKTVLDFNISLPQETMETLAHSRIRSLFATGDTDADIRDIENTLNLLVGNIVENLRTQGYLKRDNGVLSSRIELRGGHFSMNGKSLMRNGTAENGNSAEDEAAENEEDPAAETGSETSAEDGGETPAETGNASPAENEADTAGESGNTASAENGTKDGGKTAAAPPETDAEKP